MVKIIQKENKMFYQCEECGLRYEDKGIAAECQEWCKEHKSCNLDIIKNSVASGEDKKPPAIQ